MTGRYLFFRFCLVWGMVARARCVFNSSKSSAKQTKKTPTTKNYQKAHRKTTFQSASPKKGSRLSSQTLACECGFVVVGR